MKDFRRRSLLNVIQSVSWTEGSPEAFQDNTNNPDCYRRENLDEDWNTTVLKPPFSLIAKWSHVSIL